MRIEPGRHVLERQWRVFVPQQLQILFLLGSNRSKSSKLYKIRSIKIWMSFGGCHHWMNDLKAARAI